MKLPARPKIRLLAPKEIRAGTTAVLTVELESPRETPCDFVDLFVTSTSSIANGGTREHARLGARLATSRRLPRGVTELDCKVDFPAELPASYSGRLIRVTHEARVHASIPYWPDAHGTFLLTLQAAPQPQQPDLPLLFASAAGGAPARGPYAEVSLNARTVAPGGVLKGAVALFNLANRYDRIVLTLRERESAGGVSVDSTWATTLTPQGLTEGGSVPFAMRVPKTALTASGGHFRVDHHLIVTVHSGWRGLIEMPIAVQIDADAPDESTSKRPPALGEERVRVIWEAVGRARGLSFDGEALRQSHDRVALTVRRDLTGGATRLVGELAFPSLGLDLRSHPPTLLGRVLGRSLRTGVRAIDEKLSFEARHPAQAQAWLARLGSLVEPLVANRVYLEEISDEGLTLALDDSGTTEGPIAMVADRARSLAQALAPLLGEVPLPGPLEARRTDWYALAARVGTTVTTGTGLLTWTDDDAEIAVRPLFDADGQLHALRIARKEAGLLEGATPITLSHQDAADALRQSARVSARALIQDGAELHVEPEQVVLTARVGTQWPEAELASRTESCLASLARLARELRPERGPFR